MYVYLSFQSLCELIGDLTVNHQPLERQLGAIIGSRNSESDGASFLASFSQILTLIAIIDPCLVNGQLPIYISPLRALKTSPFSVTDKQRDLLPGFQAPFTVTDRQTIFRLPYCVTDRQTYYHFQRYCGADWFFILFLAANLCIRGCSLFVQHYCAIFFSFEAPLLFPAILSFDSHNIPMKSWLVFFCFARWRVWYCRPSSTHDFFCFNLEQNKGKSIKRPCTVTASYCLANIFYCFLARSTNFA